MEVQKKIERALEVLQERDFFLLKNDVNERSITHKLAIYLENEFPDWDIDCEYNRNHEDIKRLNIKRKNVMTDDTKGKTVLPDIIIHKRNTDKNFIAIEVKKSSSSESRDLDIKKLKAFKSQLGYKNAFYIEIKVEQQFENGEKYFVIEEV